jgi:hypothetical protein
LITGLLGDDPGRIAAGQRQRAPEGAHRTRSLGQVLREECPAL